MVGSSVRRHIITRVILYVVVVVIAIITVIWSMHLHISPNATHQFQRRCHKEISRIEDGFYEYHRFCGDFPFLLITGKNINSDIAPVLCGSGMKSNGFVFIPMGPSNFVDPWGSLYNIYYTRTKSTETLRIWSNGPNKKNENGSHDDISNEQ